MYRFDLELSTESGNTYYAEVEVDKYTEMGQTYTEVLNYSICDEADNLVDKEHPEFDEIMALIEDQDYEVDSENIWSDFYIEDDLSL